MSTEFDHTSDKNREARRCESPDTRQSREAMPRRQASAQHFLDKVVSRREVGAALSGFLAVGVAAGRTITNDRMPTLKGYVGDFFPFTKILKLPPIVFEDQKGRMSDLAAMKGRVVLLNFWATWCAPCVYEMPSLDRLQAQFPKSEFLVLALSEDAGGFGPIENFFQSHGLQHLGIYLDPSGRDRQAWSVPAIPTSFIIDRTGRVRGILPGAADWDSASSQSLIAYYLKGE
jgi:thiol-disulfide isomerase/thioredoxin